jgi:hypothetical protein
MIYSKLEKVIGAQLNVVGYAGNMRTFRFGPITEKRSSTGRVKFATRFGLHVQCAWRLRSDKVVTGSEDWWRKLGSDEYDENWDPFSGESVLESLLREHLQDSRASTGVIANRTPCLLSRAVP